MADVRASSITFDNYHSTKKVLTRDISQFEEKNIKLDFGLPAYKKQLQKFVTHLFNLSARLFCGIENLSDISFDSTPSSQYQTYLQAVNNLHDFVVQDVVSSSRLLNKGVLNRWVYALDELYKMNDFFSAAYIVKALITIKKVTNLDVVNKHLSTMQKNMNGRFLDDYELLRNGKILIPNPFVLCSADKFSKNEKVKYLNEKNPVTMTETLSVVRDKLLLVQKQLRTKLQRDFESKQVLPVIFKPPIDEKKFNIVAKREWFKKNDMSMLREEFLKSRNDLVFLLRNKTLNKFSNSYGCKIRSLLMESKAKLTWIDEMDAILKAEKIIHTDEQIDWMLEKIVSEIKTCIAKIIVADKKITELNDELLGKVRTADETQTRERALTKTEQDLKSTRYVRIEVPPREAMTPREERKEKDESKKKVFESKMSRSHSSKLVKSKSKLKLKTDLFPSDAAVMPPISEEPSAAATMVSEEVKLVRQAVVVIDNVLPVKSISEPVITTVADAKLNSEMMLDSDKPDTSEISEGEIQKKDELKSRSRTAPNILLKIEMREEVTNDTVILTKETTRARSKTAISLSELLRGNAVKEILVPSVRPRSTSYVDDEITKEVMEATAGSRPRSESFSSSSTAKLISQFSLPSSSAISPRSAAQKTGDVDKKRKVFEREIQDKQKRYEAIVSPRRKGKEQQNVHSQPLAKTVSAPLEESALEAVCIAERSGTFYK